MLVVVKDFVDIWKSVRVLWDFVGGFVVFLMFVDIFFVLGVDLVWCNGCILFDLFILIIVDFRIKFCIEVSFLDILLRLFIEYSCYGR